MKTITLLGDSLAMVRPEEGILYNDTYAFKLNILLGGGYILLNNARRANTIDSQTSLQNMQDELLYNDSHTVIIHLGIVDCAPRIFTLRERKILSLMSYFKLGFLANYIIKFKSKRRFFFTKYCPKTYVSEDEFEKQYEYLISTLNRHENIENIIILNICDTSEINKNKSYGYKENIIKYNQIIHKITNEYSKVRMIDMFTLSKKDGFLLNDGVHITSKAHEIVAKELYNLIKNTKY